MSRVKLLVHLPSAADPTSYYRGMGPLSQLALKHDVDLGFLNKYDWANLSLGHMLFMQRPYQSDHLNIIKMAKDNDLPVWLDYDDDLFSVPTDNPAFKVYGSDSAKKIVAECLASADIITVSTPALKEKFLKLNKNIKVIPNALMTNKMKKELRPMANPDKRQPLVTWRGSATHVRDVMSVGEQIIKVSREFKDQYFWHFIGDRLWFVTDFMQQNRVLISPPMDTIEYFQHLREIQSYVFIVPLVDTEFNRAKSNIAWIEASWSGAATIAPNIPEFDRPGVLKYETPEEFENVLRQVLLGAYDLPSLVRQSQEFIQNNLMIDQVNRLRMEIIDEYAKKD